MRRVTILLLLPVALAACGGDSSKPEAQARPTQTQFVAAANAVCVRSDRAVYRLGRLSLDPAGWGETAAAARTAIADMKTVRPPVGKDAAFAALVAEGQKLADGIQQVHDALVEKNYAKARAAQQKATNADTAIHKQARKLGLTFCQQLLTNWPA